MSVLSQPLKINGLEIRNRVFLAPMSGVSDLPFRKLSWQSGAGMVVSEMVASAELCKGHSESHMRLRGDGLPQHIVQLAGCDPYWMGEAAQIVEEFGADMIDINMGCPAKKVTGGYSGAALMQDLPLALSLIEAVLKKTKIPVSLKMRLGWDDTTFNAPKLAQMAQSAGISMITVHGRTRMQFYNGKANWDAIKAVRDVIDIPLVANGDVCCQQDAMEILGRSGADAVMIGRGCYGRPWLVGEIAGHAFQHDLLTYIIQHYEDMLDHYGEDNGQRHARKHLSWYLEKHLNGTYTENERRNLLTSINPRDVIKLIKELFNRKTNQHKEAALC